MLGLIWHLRVLGKILWKKLSSKKTLRSDIEWGGSTSWYCGKKHKQLFHNTLKQCRSELLQDVLIITMCNRQH